MDQSPPLSWIKKVIECVPEAVEIPLFGYAPPFHVQHLSSLLSSQFETHDFSIKLHAQTWCCAEEIKQGLGFDPFLIALCLNPLKAPLHFAMSQTDFSLFTAWMMHKKEREPLSQPLKEGFCRFLLLEAIDASSQIEPLQRFTMRLDETAAFPEGSVFCVEVELGFSEHACWAKLIISPSFRSEWIAHFSFKSVEYIPNEMTRTLELPVMIRTGSIRLSQKEWQKLEPGDFLLLDANHYDLKRQAGIATMAIGTVVLFHVQIEDGKMKILDYTLVHEDTMEYDEGEEPPAVQDGESQESDPPKEEPASLSQDEESAAFEGETASPSMEEEQSSSIQELPLNICVEVARLQMTLDRLMHLQPGNLLELPVNPDQGVSLTVNGKKVGRAELVYLGELLGIRILEIG